VLGDVNFFLAHPMILSISHRGKAGSPLASMNSGTSLSSNCSLEAPSLMRFIMNDITFVRGETSYVFQDFSFGIFLSFLII